MILQLPTRIQAHIDAGKRVMSLLADTGFHLTRDTDSEAGQASDVIDGRTRLDKAEAEMATLKFALQLLKALQLGREAKWKEAYAEIAAAGEFARGKTDLSESWALVRYQLDYMKVEAEPVTEQS